MEFSATTDASSFRSSQTKRINLDLDVVTENLVGLVNVELPASRC